MNQVIITGRICHDLELKQTTSGKQFVQFKIAVNRIKKDETDFIPCIAWEQKAELMVKYTGKGKRIGIIGRLQVDQSEKDGSRVEYYKVIANEVEFLEYKEKQSETAEAYGHPPMNNRPPARDEQTIDHYDLPF